MVLDNDNILSGIPILIMAFTSITLSYYYQRPLRISYCLLDYFEHTFALYHSESYISALLMADAHLANTTLQYSPQRLVLFRTLRNELV